MKKCVVIPDSFKSSLSAIEICNIAKTEIQKAFPNCLVNSVPVADGGEGTVDCFLQALDGERVVVEVHDPYMKPLKACYGYFQDFAVIEMAAAAGLPLVGDIKNPAITTTYGVGELIRHAVEHGAKRIILGLGGSATNDGGCGCAAALGVRFTNVAGKSFIPVGNTLSEITTIDISSTQELLKDCEIIAMCDIQNPMFGKNGAAYIFGPQKGADKKMVELLDKELISLDKILQAQLGLTNVATLAGAGAAGAMGAGVVAFLGGKLSSGIETILNLVNFDTLIQTADAIFTGEGKIDAQSLQGKVICGVAKRAKKQHIPVYAIVGDVGDDAYGAYDIGVTAIFSINRLAVPFSIAKTRSRQDYQHTLRDILNLMKSIK